MDLTIFSKKKRSMDLTSSCPIFCSCSPTLMINIKGVPESTNLSDSIEMANPPQVAI